MTKNPLVSICCTAYNHEKFIKETLDSFLMQETNFEFEILVNDDCSTDNTADILKAYEKKFPNKFRNTYQTENQYSKGIKPWYHVQFPMARGKYIALCEGDDYWTDPLKLQKQIDFLQSNPDYSIAWCKYKHLVMTESNNLVKNADWEGHLPKNQNLSFDFDNIFNPYCTYTLTAVFRNDIDIEFFKQLKYSKDNSLYIYMLTKGKGVLLDFYGGMYRIHDGGIYSKKNLLFQRYSSFLNLEELLIAMPHILTDNLKKIRKSLIKESLKIVNQNDKSYHKILDFSKKHIGLIKTYKIVLIKKFSS